MARNGARAFFDKHIRALGRKWPATAGKVCYVVLLSLPGFPLYCEYPPLDYILGRPIQQPCLGIGLRSSQNVYT